jgi:hypothetical protein
MAEEVHPGIYVNSVAEYWDGKGNKTVKPTAVTILMSDGWTVFLEVQTGMQKDSGDMDVVVTNKRVTGEEGAIRMKATCRDESKHLGWLVRRFTVVKQKEGI